MPQVTFAIKKWPRAPPPDTAASDGRQIRRDHAGSSLPGPLPTQATVSLFLFSTGLRHLRRLATRVLSCADAGQIGLAPGVFITG